MISDYSCCGVRSIFTRHPKIRSSCKEGLRCTQLRSVCIRQMIRQTFIHIQYVYIKYPLYHFEVSDRIVKATTKTHRLCIDTYVRAPVCLCVSKCRLLNLCAYIWMPIYLCAVCAIQTHQFIDCILAASERLYVCILFACPVSSIHGCCLLWIVCAFFFHCAYFLICRQSVNCRRISYTKHFLPNILIWRPVATTAMANRGEAHWNGIV